MKVNRTFFKVFSLIYFIIISIYVSPVFAQFIQVQQQDRDLDLTRRESAVSERIQTQIEQILGNYYANDAFIVNIKAYLSRIPVKDPSAKTEEPEIEADLPGLPIQPAEIASKEIEQFVIDKWVFSDRFKIKYIYASILLDEKVFSNKDISFINTVVKVRAGIDENRGDILTLRTLQFPPPANAPEIFAKKDIGITEEQKVTKGLLKEVYPYLYFGGAALAFLLFLIILLQVINMIKAKRHPQDLFSPYGYQLPGKPQAVPATAGLPGMEPQVPAKPAITPTGMPMPKTESPDTKDMLYELRQLMVTTLIGNPKLGAEVFKRWVELEQDNGIYQISGFLKATDPRLLDLLSEHLGRETSSKVQFAMNQMTSIDKESVIETLKKFREEFQKEQALKASKPSTEDVFEFLKQLTPEQIFHVIKDEPVGIMAIALAQVPPEVANAVFKELPVEKQSKIPVEIGRLKKIPVSAYQDLADKLSKKAMEVKKIKFITTDGVDALGNILEQSTPEKEQEILAAISLHDIELADELRKVYITFDELTKFPDKHLAEIMRSFDRELITKALIDADLEIKEKILNNLPIRMKIMIGDDVKMFEESGEIPIDEIQKARRAITQKIRDMAKTGLIDIKKLFGTS